MDDRSQSHTGTTTTTAAATEPRPLASYRIPALPPSIYYIPSFLSPAEESYVLDKLPGSSPRWTQLSHRRLQAHPTALTGADTLLQPSPLPDWLTRFPPVSRRFDGLAVFADAEHRAPNHCLVNEYRPGQGIMPHQDGPAYAPVVATVSLGSPIVLDLYENAGEAGLGPVTWRLLQEPRSLLVTRGDAYRTLLHGIAPVTVDEGLVAENIVNWELLGDRERFERDGRSFRETRISLTYRDVLKVSKIGMGILGKK